MRICVTGGAGFIGSNLVGRLLDDGHEVLAIDNFASGKLKNINEFIDNPNFRFVETSIMDGNLKEILKGIRVVFHEAAKVDVRESVRKPESTFMTNVDGTENILRACADCGVKRIVFASSCAVYSEDHAPSSESSSLSPKSPYAESKIIGENMVRKFSIDNGIEYAILRYFNVYGPKQRIDSDYSGVIPTFISRALDGEDLVINGDGEQIRDFIFVDDVVKANTLCLNANATGETLNVGTGIGTSINDLARMVIELTGSISKLSHAENNAEEIRHSVADTTNATLRLGYSSGYHIEDGLKLTIDWIRNNK